MRNGAKSFGPKCLPKNQIPLTLLCFSQKAGLTNRRPPAVWRFTKSQLEFGLAVRRPCSKGDGHWPHSQREGWNLNDRAELAMAQTAVIVHCSTCYLPRIPRQARPLICHKPRGYSELFLQSKYPTPSCPHRASFPANFISRQFPRTGHQNTSKMGNNKSPEDPNGQFRDRRRFQTGRAQIIQRNEEIKEEAIGRSRTCPDWEKM